MLMQESRLIHKLRGKTSVPHLHCSGNVKCTNSRTLHVIVMDLLGPSLEELFVKCNRHFDLKTILPIAFQMISTIRVVHEERIIHRDIKPDNFLIGAKSSDQNTVHLIDFGLSKCVIQSNGTHISMKEGKSMTGTVRYASINTHQGYE